MIYFSLSGQLTAISSSLPEIFITELESEIMKAIIFSPFNAIFCKNCQYNKNEKTMFQKRTAAFKNTYFQLINKYLRSCIVHHG